MIWEESKQWITIHARLLAYLLCSVFITVWTLLRFFTGRTIFDLVGQQVLAGQWLHGNVDGASVGVTNYIPKLVLLYMPLHELPGSPRLKLCILTILVNIATITLIGLLLERLLRQMGTKVGGAFYTSLIWLSALAGSVFWIQFTNSRNLEVVGGVFLLYLGICYLKQPDRRLLGSIAAFSSVLFFADTLQVYMTAVPLLLYGISARGITDKIRRSGWLAAAIIVGFMGSKLIFALVSHLLHLHILQADGASILSLDFLVQGISGTLRSLAHLYVGGADAGRVREIVNIAFLLMMTTAFVYSLRRKLIPVNILLIVGYVVLVDIMVYIASGEAQQVGTERYLIMTAPALVLLFSSLELVWRKFRTLALLTVGALLVVNLFFLCRALVTGAQMHFSQDSHLTSVRNYLNHSPTTLAYSSMDTALPMTYLYGSGPLPLSCSGTILVKTDTFYDRAAYHRLESAPHKHLVVILDGSAIANTPRVCSAADIIAQFGQPSAVDMTDDGSLVLHFPMPQIQNLHY